MRALCSACVFVLASLLISCSQDEGSVTVKVSGSSFPVIPATATSCLAVKKAAGTSFPPFSDVQASYFRVPRVTFERKDTSKDLIIAQIKITVNIPGNNAPYECQPAVAGDNLAALRQDWYSGNKEAMIPKGSSATYTTECPIYCGGIDMDPGLVASGTLEVLGFERDANGDENPVRTSTAITIESN